MTDTAAFFEPSEERTICLLFDSTSKTDEPHCEVVGKVEIWVSKELLAIASPVFKSMFYGNFREKQNLEPIHLPGKNLDDFLILLQCLSPDIDRREIDQSIAQVVFPLAHEYQMKLMIEKCVKCFKGGLAKIPIGDLAILDDVPFFVKYGLTDIIKYIIPYAAALSIQIIGEYRKGNKEKLPTDHAFYFAVYEAKAHRLSLEQQTNSINGGSNRSRNNRRYNGYYYTEQQTPQHDFHQCNSDEADPKCLCGYQFDFETLNW